ncbi:hypothetical protein ACQKNX_23685 [Lysinibacillus sp. NPDC093712]|uniref:hypothetical protein n=1 Tax=Lysinibacillus sp. NPDC093712 TaxID=3390579 RepID=UPI003D061FAB
MSDVKLSSFPSNKTAALTMLYLEKQDFSNLTPSQLVDKYDEVYYEITQRMKENKKGKKFSF